ncbi:hypothetical protein J4410_07815 [Candidatus Woesearchaeota archaeon]|nr:hypothetical protein [Candidatus Woesearchaeota archaeon]
MLAIKMKSKKSQISKSLGYVIGFVILLALIVFSVRLITTRIGGGGAKDISNLVDDTADPDKDGLSNYYDLCDCLSGDRENEGCPYDKPKVGIEADAREKKCKALHKV